MSIVESIDGPSFLAGLGVATLACGVIYWVTVARMRRQDVAWRALQLGRIGELAARSDRMYDQSRRDLDLPPGIAS